MNYTMNNGTTTIGYILFLILLLLFYLALYWYLEQILPNENGLSKSACFCLKKEKNNKRGTKKKNSRLEMIEGMKRDDVIKVDKLVKQFGDFKAVDDISFDISSNKVTCILGHNGAGKSTLINMMCGILKSTSGDVKKFSHFSYLKCLILDSVQRKKHL